MDESQKVVAKQAASDSAKDMQDERSQNIVDKDCQSQEPDILSGDAHSKGNKSNQSQLGMAKSPKKVDSEHDSSESESEASVNAKPEKLYKTRVVLNPRSKQIAIKK